ncbi:glutamate--cysteine ligase [Ottowia cancrivicina]|uniref:Glutamate--cysteine ligase n=1 Tax=Ottowia cancrivicina TaxID=3040346 RepID=A0AAW6RNI8_9BURK|nr:glutamate--cysteine ligase [Ottowia sp. 10c7w1]MDG9699903.1 glutamate--cysteine ligase [Ottowia sp. 10c7w1]
MNASSDLLLRRLAALPPEALPGMRRGLEKESLRAAPDGALALTPHPAALGSPLTHPHITTDFSESQPELVTGTHGSVQACLDELRQIHQVVYAEMAALGDEMLWASSMPCKLPPDEMIPLGYYGTSNVGRAKSVYRMGLGHRYGRRMQTISGIHYNWSLPGAGSEQYFGLIRNFRRHAFLLLYLFGASPVVCGTFVQGRQHALQPLGSRAIYLPHATSLRMGRLGYQSDAQSTLAVSYNGLEGYAASLQDALTRPWPAYEAIGIQAPSGDYNQLAVTLLQIENEFYGTIRPKRVIEPGERPLHALRARGVEYVEVRLMDLNPFLPVGIDEQTMRFLDVFLLHCLLSDSPPDSPAEIEALKRNQHLVAERGREPGLKLACGGMEVALTDWAAQVLGELPALARALDEALGGDGHQAAVQAAQQALHNPALLPSARVLAALPGYGDSYVAFMLDRSQQIRSLMLAQPPGAALRQRFAEMAVQSRAQQHAIEVSDTLSFEQYRREYTSPARLSPQA